MGMFAETLAEVKKFNSNFNRFVNQVQRIAGSLPTTDAGVMPIAERIYKDMTITNLIGAAGQQQATGITEENRARFHAMYAEMVLRLDRGEFPSSSVGNRLEKAIRAHNVMLVADEL